jgi:phosphate transport system permease protein
MSTPARPRRPDSSATLPILSTPTSRRTGGLRTSQLAYGQPLLWLCGGALVLCLVMILGLLFIVLRYGLPTFWPKPLVQITTYSGQRLLGEMVREDSYVPEKGVFTRLPQELRPAAERYVQENEGRAARRLMKIGNFEFTQAHHTWISDFEIKEESEPEWALLIERAGNEGRFYGVLTAFLQDGKVVATDPAAAWSAYEKHHGEVLARVRERYSLEKHDIGRVNRKIKEAELHVKDQAIRFGVSSPQHQEAARDYQSTNETAQQEFTQINSRIAELNRENQRYKIRLVTADSKTKELTLGEIVRAYPANRLGVWDKLGVYFSRWAEFIGDDPRNVNTEGGVFPCIWGTLAMTMIMSIFVVPFGVLAALYLREYARSGPMISAIRIAVNNLAGVPSIVFGVFGLGFFCYLVGGSIDQVFFQSKLPTPTYGTGGILWASLTLALLTLPLVIVATEEALASVPRSMREGSYACGASKWQTIRRIVLPRAMPGILTGMILAMARGAGEVAPLMLVGAMKLAPELPVDTVFPYIHPERSFMHLGFHIYDVGFQSPDSESSKPMVFVTTMLLIFLVVLLNLGAMWLRNRLRKKYKVSHF